VDLKKEIRTYYDKGNHSIHIPDTQKECDTFLDLLNYNTLSFMDKTPSMYINFPNFNNLFEKLKQFCKENNIDDLDLLKLDIEGHEYEALKGAENMFKNDKVLLCQFEFGGCNIDSRCFFQDFFYFFTQCNMIICRICPDKLVAVQGYNELYEHFRTTNYLT
jgi:hypothetical protein